MRITFILPGHGANPVGGFKVVYEYANRLSNLGYDISLVHLAEPQTRKSIYRTARSLIKFAAFANGYKGGYRPVGWAYIDKRIRTVWVPWAREEWIPNADVVVATGWQTAESIRRFNNSKGRKLYLIHDYEHFMIADPAIRDRMASTYSGDFFKIVTSPAGVEMLKQCGSSPDAYIPNAIDSDVYYQELKLNDPSRTYIGFPWRREVYKGTNDALKAFEIVKAESGGKLDIWTFGHADAKELPGWIDYHRFPSDRELRGLYNRSRIFVMASHYEGWGLPGAESMACGCALVSTDNIGVRAYAEHEKTALLSPVKRPEILAQNIFRLIEDNEQRIQIAKEGNYHIRQFTWERAVKSFEKCITGHQ